MITQLRLTLVLFVWIGLCCSLHSQTFRCDGRLILITNGQSFSQVRFITFAPFVISYGPVATYIGERFQGLGFNPKDNYIYGVRESTNTVVRLRSDGTFETLGPVPSLNPFSVFAGDCRRDGKYLIHDKSLNQILVYSVVEDFVLEDRIDLYWDPSSVNSEPFTTRLDDFAIDPNNPDIAYAVQASSNFDPDILPVATQGHLLSINLDLNSPNVGMVTPIAPMTSNIDITRVGSLFFNDFNVLHGYGAQEPAANAQDNRLFGINTQTAAANAIGAGSPNSPATDGCSCPYNLSVHYLVDPLVATCTDDEVTYDLTVTNRSFETLSDVILTDTIPEGMVIEEIERNFGGEIDPSTGVGTRFLTINGIEVPPRGIMRMTIRARIIDIPVGNANSQVFLRNLPSLFDGERMSDDPSTSNTDDPAIFFADAIWLDDVAVDVTPPTDCLADNDGQVVLTSPQFLPGVSYNVGLYNEDWEYTQRDVVVDGNNTFILDSIPSGIYRLDQVQPEGLMCSYEWKDTTIMLEAPNDQLQVSIESNSPLCAGMDLRVNASLFPGGSVVWQSPLYIVNDSTFAWEDISADFTGTYEMTATYGACEQIREEEVLVEEAIDATIVGKSDYCEREPLELLAEGVGDTLLSFQWFGPNNLMDTSRLIEVTAMTFENEGEYQVVIDNRACQDTALLDVIILPSPTIEIPPAVEADFCDPVVLQPTITGDSDVAYTWAPSEGLSCDDCPNPTVELPLLPVYQLQVINDTLCTDSATVQVYFDSEDLIYIPNAFSPNFDGINDYFQLFPSCVVSTIKELNVYDRWGGQVFSAGPIDSEVPREFWDGRINGKPAGPGTYLWQTKIELIDGTTRRLTGEVNLLR